MINEERYEYVEGDNKISGGIYYMADGTLLAKSRYVRKLNWIEKLCRKIRKK